MLLDKHKIFAADDLPTKLVPMPEWGGDVKIKKMSVGQQIEYEAYTENNKADAVFFILVLCCVDDENKPIFTLEDLPLLKKKSDKSIIKVFNEIMSLNNIEPNSVENSAKN